MQLHIWAKTHCYFVVWTECDYAEVIVERDPSFTKVMEILEHFVFTFFYPYLLSKARSECVERFKAAQEERRLKKLRKVEGQGNQGLQFYVPVVSSAKIVWTKRTSTK